MELARACNGAWYVFPPVADKAHLVCTYSGPLTVVCGCAFPSSKGHKQFEGGMSLALHSCPRPPHQRSDSFGFIDNYKAC